MRIGGNPITALLLQDYPIPFFLFLFTKKKIIQLFYFSIILFVSMGHVLDTQLPIGAHGFARDERSQLHLDFRASFYS